MVRLTLDDVVMSGPEGFTWPRQSGALPVVVPVVMHQEASEQLSRKGAEALSAKLDGAFWGGSGEGRVAETIGGIYLWEPVSLERNHRPRWLLTDMRAHLMRLWVFADFSLRRLVNEFKLIQDGPLGDFNRAGRLDYIAHTQLDTSAPDDDPGFAPANATTEGGRAWTAKKAVIYLLQRWVREYPGRIWPDIPAGEAPELVDDSGPDNGRNITGFRAAAPWPFVVRKLLRMAHLGLDVTPDRQWRLHSLDPVDLSQLGGVGSAPRLLKGERSRVRARNVRLLMRLEQELRTNYLEGASNADDDAPDALETVERLRDNPGQAVRDIQPTLRNVTILPQDIREVATGRTYRRGTIVTLQKACELYNQDPDNPPPRTYSSKGKPVGRITFSMDWVRRYIMSSALATLMTFDARVNRSRDDVYGARAAAFYGDTRQLFQLPIAWLDFIETIRAESVEIQDPVTGRRAMSSVYMDHFMERSARWFGTAGVTDSGRRAGENRYAWGGALRGVTDFDQLPLDQAQAAPYQVSWVDKAQGLFRVHALPDLYGHTIRLIPSLFDEAAIPLTSLGSGNQWQLEQMRWAAAFRLSIKFTITLRAPNSTGRFLVRDLGPAQGGPALGPPHEVFFGMTHAAREWIDPLQADRGSAEASRVQLAPNGELQVTGGRLANASTVDDIARAMLDDVSFSYKDRYIGRTAHPGYRREQGPEGQLSRVALRVRQGRIETLYGAENTPEPPPLWELLPSDTQAFLWRLEDQVRE